MDDKNSSTSDATEATAPSPRAHNAGDSGAERAIRTLKEQLLWVRHFETVEELRQALAAFAVEHNASWLRQRHGYKTPDQVRDKQIALEPEAAMGVKMAAQLAQLAVL